MYTYTGGRNFYGQLTNNDSTTNLAFGDKLINDFTRTVCVSNGGKWWFLEKVTTQSTVASQQAYKLPQSTRKIIDLYVTVGSTIYSPIQVEDPALWKRVLQSQLGTGDRTLFYYRQGNTVLLAPTPGTSSNTITIRTRKNVVDLRDADYTTGTISTTLSDETVTGAGTTFTSAMAGRYINLTSGDGLWYEIESFTDTTHLELTDKYEGATVSGSDFIIGQVSPLPETYQPLPIYRAAALYWQKQNDPTKSQMYSDLAQDLMTDMLTEASEKVEGAYIPPANNLVFRDPNIPEPRVPTSSFI